jgi:hypothetical protein
MNTKNLIRASEYAKTHGISTVAVYKKAEKGEIAMIMILKEKFVDVEATDKLQPKLFNKRASKKYGNEHKECVKLWFDFYKERNGIEPVFNGKEGQNLKKLIEYFEKFSPSKSVQCFEYILRNWDNLDKFVKDKYSIAMVYHSINAIVAKLKGSGSSIDLSDLSDKFRDV